MAALKSRAKVLRTCMTCYICVSKVCFETNVTFRFNKMNGNQWLLATFRKYKKKLKYTEIVKGLKLSSVVVRSFKSFHGAPVWPRAAL